MSKLSEARKRLSRLAAKRAKQLKRFRRSKPGTRSRSSAKRALARLASLIAEATALLKSARIDWNGCTPIPKRFKRQRKAVRWVLRKVPGVYVSSTLRTSSDTYHGTRLGPRATDLGSGDPSETPERKAQHALYEKFGPEAFLELFGPDNYPWVKNGFTYTASEGEMLETLHDNHTHFVMR